MNRWRLQDHARRPLRMVLEELGWRVERRARADGGGLDVWDADGVFVGSMWAGDVWALLRQRGLVDADGRVL